MAINVPIVSQFVPTGIDKATREFKKLETTGQKVGFALQKAFLPAAAALGALTVAAGASVKAAAEDAAQQEELARQLKATTGATDDQVAANEAFIASMELAVAVSDAELRPALGNLVRGTGDLKQAQDLLAISLDVAAATGKDLNAVTEAMAKAAQGEMTALKRLDPSLTAVIASGADADEVFSALSETFGGAAAQAADTVQGRFERMQIQLDNAAEAIGYALLPIVEALLPALESMATWVGQNTDLIIGIGAAVGSFAAAIVAANIAMKAWAVVSGITTAINGVLATSFTALQVASGLIIFTALIGVFVVLQQKFDIFGKAVDALTWYFQTWWDVVKWVIGKVIDAINLLIKAWNKLPLVDDIPEISKEFLGMGDAAEAGADAAIPAMEDVAYVVGSAEGELARFKNQAEQSAQMLESALVPAVTLTGEYLNTAAWELKGFYDELDREDAFAKFQENLADVQTELAGLEPGSAEFEQNMRDAFRAVQELSNTLGYIPAELEKKLLYRIEIGDIAGAERLAGLISASDTYRATAQDELRFLSGASQSPSGLVSSTNITVNVQGADPNAVVDALQRYNRNSGPVPVNVR